MTPFTIFALVVTFGYVIYYAAIITIDMNAKPKDANGQEETLDTHDILPDTDDQETSDDASFESDDVVASVPVIEDSPSFITDDEPTDPVLQPFMEGEGEREGESDDIDTQQDDNPYGLSDEDDSFQEQQTADDDAPPSEDLSPSDQEQTVIEENEHQEQTEQEESSHEPEVHVYEPEPENGGLAVDINNNNEPISPESTTPYPSHMLASNVFDIMGIQHSFYGDHQSTLSNESPEVNDDTPDVIDRI